MRNALTIIIISALASCTAYSDANNPPPVPQEEQPEILTRGPVHEAFAQPVELENQPGVVAPNEPPGNIIENPPDEKPSGKQFVWVPGYWAWDADRKSYIWVSGCWRAAPPGMYWVPGYWSQTASGWEWVAGFWASSSDKQIEYLPTPPPVENIEAPQTGPSADAIWAPPCWYWRDGRYILRDGYWLEPFDDWVWTPSHYVWTPRGYVFIAGHWDYALSRRGVLFAPVYIPRPLYLRPGFSLSLSAVVDIGLLDLNLFTFPRYCHYYFGDYYDDFYIGLGIYPQFEWRMFHTWYDPLYVHDRWRHHQSPQAWYNHQRHEYDLRVKDRSLRPPRTYRDMQQRLAEMPLLQRNNFRMVDHLNRNESFKFEKINPKLRESYFGNAAELQQFRNQRRQWESQNIGPGALEQPQQGRVGMRQERKILQPPTEQRQAQAPTRQREGMMPPTSAQSESRFGRHREFNLSRPENIRIPSPPIKGMQNRRGIFGRSITPSRPEGERSFQGRSGNRSEGSRRK